MKTFIAVAAFLLVTRIAHASVEYAGYFPFEGKMHSVSLSLAPFPVTAASAISKFLACDPADGGDHDQCQIFDCVAQLTFPVPMDFRIEGPGGLIFRKTGTVDAQLTLPQKNCNDPNVEIEAGDVALILASYIDGIPLIPGQTHAQVFFQGSGKLSKSAAHGLPELGGVSTLERGNKISFSKPNVELEEDRGTLERGSTPR